MDGLVRCASCRSLYPRVWETTRGAVHEILPQRGGSVHFCSQGCRVRFHLAFLKGLDENKDQVRQATDFL